MTVRVQTKGAGIRFVTSDWVGCLSGTFTTPADWTIVNAAYNIANNVGSGVALGLAKFTNASCGAALNQETFAVWQGITPRGAGNSGYRYDGPGVRLGGTILGNRTGYSFECGFVDGTINNICNGFTLNFALERWNAGAQTVVDNSFSVAGPTLAQGTIFRITAVGSLVTCYLNSTVIYTFNDPSPLGAGNVGLSSSASCGGITPLANNWQYIKARNL